MTSTIRIRNGLRLDGCGTFTPIALAALIVAAMTSAGAAESSRGRIAPLWSVDTRAIGVAPARYPPNKYFRHGDSYALIASSDPNNKVTFLSNSLVVVYHSSDSVKGDHGEVRSLEAWCFNVKSGFLEGKRAWPIIARASDSNYVETEGRIIPLRRGAFALHAEGSLLIFSGWDSPTASYVLDLRQFWGSKSVRALSGGSAIAIYHGDGLRSEGISWLSDALRPIADSGSIFNKRQPFELTTGESINVAPTMLNSNKQGVFQLGSEPHDDRALCQSLVCSSAEIVGLNEREAVVSGRRGIGVVSLDSGLLWFASPPSDSRFRDSVALGPVRPALEGSAFALYLLSSRAATLGPIHVRKGTSIVVFSSKSGEVRVEVPVVAKNGDVDYALSPNGNILAVFDGRRLWLYPVETALR